MRVVNHDPPNPFCSQLYQQYCYGLYSVTMLLWVCSHDAHIAHVTRDYLLESSTASSYTTSLAGNRNVRARDSPPFFLLVGDAASGASTCYTFELWPSPYFPSHPKCLLESSGQQGSGDRGGQNNSTRDWKMLAEHDGGALTT